MRFLMVVLVALSAFFPRIVLASVPEPIAPRGGFIPLHKSSGGMGDEGMKLPSRGGRFLPLSPRASGQMLPIAVPVSNKESAPKGVLSALPSARNKPLSEEDAKLLLSIFSADD